MKSSRALQARLMLVDVYLDDEVGLTARIIAVVNEINAAINDRDPNRSTCSYSNFSNSQVIGFDSESE